MNVLVVDTSAWISYFDGQEQPEVDAALKGGRVVLPPLVAAELMSGVVTDSEMAVMREFLEELGVYECPLSHWIGVGRLRRRLLEKGFRASTPDAHIAQVAIETEGYLLSSDKVFAKIAKYSRLKLAM